MIKFKINFSRSNRICSYEETFTVVKKIHSLLGDNKFHDKPSNYSISFLLGGKSVLGGKALQFNKNPHIIVSSIENDFIESLLEKLSVTNLRFKDMMSVSPELIAQPDFTNSMTYFTATPMLFVHDGGSEDRRITLSTLNLDAIITDKTKRKLKAINSDLNVDHLKIIIDREAYPKDKKIVFSHGNKININHSIRATLRVDANPEVQKYIYHLGLGKSTGSGFGCLLNKI